MTLKYTDLTKVASTPSLTTKDGKYNASVPNPFDGTPEKTKTFFKQLYLYFTTRGTELNTAEAQIYFTLSYMKRGLAESWARQELDEIEQFKKDYGQFKYADFDTFKEKVDK
jgi:hypothetical protein